VAVPAMLNIFENLEDSGWFKKPKRVVKKRVCLEPIVVQKLQKMVTWVDYRGGISTYTLYNF